MQVLSYPLNVEESDGDYILFTIFETLKRMSISHLIQI